MTLPSLSPKDSSSANLKNSSSATSSKARIFWSRLWSISKVVCAATVTVATLITAVLTYEDQHQTDAGAAASKLRQQAEVITFFQSEDTGTVYIDNYSDEPASDAELITHIVLNGKAYPISINIGRIPSCSSGIITGSGLSYWKNDEVLFKTNSGSNKPPDAGPVTIASMYFTDNNGNNWQYLADGPLEASPPPPLLYPPGGIDEAVPMPSGGAYENGNYINIFPSYDQKESCSQ